MFDKNFHVLLSLGVNLAMVLLPAAPLLVHKTVVKTLCVRSKRNENERTLRFRSRGRSPVR
jgi:hypothetical protein